METISTHQQVLNYLGNLGASNGEIRGSTTEDDSPLMTVLRALDRASKEGAGSIAQEISAVQDWATRPVKAEYRKRFEEINGPALSGGDSELSEAATTMLAVSYLKAKEVMASPSVLTDLQKRIEEMDNSGYLLLADKIARLNSDFIGELLIETRQQAATNTEFARELAGALEEVKQIGENCKHEEIVIPGIREENVKSLQGWEIWIIFQVVCVSWFLWVCIAAAIAIVVIWIWIVFS